MSVVEGQICKVLGIVFHQSDPGYWSRMWPGKLEKGLGKFIVSHYHGTDVVFQLEVCGYRTELKCLVLRSCFRRSALALWISGTWWPASSSSRFRSARHSPAHDERLILPPALMEVQRRNRRVCPTAGNFYKKKLRAFPTAGQWWSLTRRNKRAYPTAGQVEKKH